ncbi:MAG: RNA polymerase sigma factor SigZ, partial [Planctomycetota bacterium]
MDRIEEIWKEYHDRLHRFIEARVDDTHTADDILQEVFVRIHSQIDSLKENNKIQGWIYQITRNAIIDHYRAQHKMQELPEELSASEPELSDTARQDIDNCLMPMIWNLPDTYREAVMLSEIEGQTQKEVAEKIGISVSGAKSRVQRGRGMIKDMLLDCCKFEFDHQGNVMDYERK